jgi:hypothetical protein
MNFAGHLYIQLPDNSRPCSLKDNITSIRIMLFHFKLGKEKRFWQPKNAEFPLGKPRFPYSGVETSALGGRDLLQQ